MQRCTSSLTCSCCGLLRCSCSFADGRNFLLFSFIYHRFFRSVVHIRLVQKISVASDSARFCTEKHSVLLEDRSAIEQDEWEELTELSQSSRDWYKHQHKAQFFHFKLSKERHRLHCLSACDSVSEKEVSRAVKHSKCECVLENAMTFIQCKVLLQQALEMLLQQIVCASIITYTFSSTE